MSGQTHVFDSFECAAELLAPTCGLCGRTADSDSYATGRGTNRAKRIRRYDVIWLLVLLLLILAIGGGVALSKFLFLLLVVALVVALFGAFGRTT